MPDCVNNGAWAVRPVGRLSTVGLPGLDQLVQHPQPFQVSRELHHLHLPSASHSQPSQRLRGRRPSTKSWCGSAPALQLGCDPSVGLHDRLGGCCLAIGPQDNRLNFLEMEMPSHTSPAYKRRNMVTE
jgi:hypothetical protein